MNLSEKHIFQIAKLKTKQERFDIIESNLKFDSCTYPADDDDSSSSVSSSYKSKIVVNLLNEFIEFCLRTGFTLCETVEWSDFLFELFFNLSFANCTLTTTIECFVQKLKEFQSSTSPVKLNALISYMNKSIFTHFSLHKYVFSVERVNYVRQTQLDFYSPSRQVVEESPLHDSILFEKWEQSQRMAKQKREEAQLEERYQLERQVLNKNEDMARNLIQFVRNENENDKTKNDVIDDDEEPQMNEEVLRKMIDELTSPYLQAVTKSLKHDIKESKEKAELFKRRKNLR